MTVTNVAEHNSKSPMTHMPPLPHELIESIIQETWYLNMTIPERITLFTSLCLVNHTWLSFFIRTALMDVHIVTSSFADKYLELLHERSPALNEPDSNYFLPNASLTANRLCRSITFHIDHNPHRNTRAALAPAIRMYAEKNPIGDSISTILYMIDTLAYTPHLRRVSVQYTDWGFSDLFDQMRMVPLPAHVTDVEVGYAFSEELRGTAESLRKLHWRNPDTAWTMPSVRRLTVMGAPDLLVGALVQTCPNLEELHTDGIYCVTQSWLHRMPKSFANMVLHFSADTKDKFRFEDREESSCLVCRLCPEHKLPTRAEKWRAVLCVDSPSQSRLQLAETVRRTAATYGHQVVLRSTYAR